MRHTRPFMLAAAGAMLVLGLAACSADAGDGGASGTGLTQADSPLATYLSAAWGGDMSPEEQQQRFEEQDRKVQDLVAACMQQQGFEYTPVASGGVVLADAGDIEWKPDDRAWVQQYGYGIVKNPWASQQPSAPETKDPNQTYQESLSESESLAYQDALWGAQDAPASDDGAVTYDWTKSGCYGSAQHEVYESGPLDDARFAPLLDDVNTLYSSLGTGADYDALNATWAACMADEGHAGFTAQPDAQASISQQVNDYWSTATAGTDSSTDPAYQQIGDDEVQLALADLTCREKTDYNDEQLKIQFAQEERFIADHRSELEAFKNAAEQQR